MPELHLRPGISSPDDARRRSRTNPPESTACASAAKPAGGENMAFLTAMANSYGARWFDEKWQPQFNSPEWKSTLSTYVNLMHDAGPPGASSNGFNENLALFNAGKCGMWIDATVAASFVTDPKQSRVADNVGLGARAKQRPGKRTRTGSGPGTSPFPPARRRSRRPRSSSPGRQARNTLSSSLPRKAGRGCLRERAPRSIRTRSIRNPLRSRN